MRKEDEEVSVVQRTLVIPEVWKGIKSEGIEGFEPLVREHGTFKRRGDVEVDPNWQQVIPYLVFEHQSKYFLMQRRDDGGEERLKNLYSLGIGGHLRKDDMEGKTILDWAKREFEEEIDYQGQYTPEPVGLLNDDTNEVGQVHLGYVFLLHGNSNKIQVRDEHISGKLCSLEQMSAIYPQMETWSQLVYDFLKAG